MSQYKTAKPQAKKLPEAKQVKVSLSSIDSVAKELVIDDVRVVLVNVDFVINLEKRIKLLESQVDSLKSANSALLQKVRNLK